MHRFSALADGIRSRTAASRWPFAALAFLLAACSGSPHAAVPQPPAAQGAAVAAIAQCNGAAAAHGALQRVAQELQGQGLALHASCPATGTGWVVQVRVVDGMKASKVVRGPLADGHEVDMGTPAGVNLAGAQPVAAGFSPDVRFNREWLRATMARHQFENASDAWWRFAQRGAAPSASGAETDLAAR